MSDSSDKHDSDMNDRLPRILTANEFLDRIIRRKHGQLERKNSIFFIGVREYKRAWDILANPKHSSHGYAYDKLQLVLESQIFLSTANNM